MALGIFLTTAAFAGQGAQRMLYTVPNSAFIENPTGDTNVVTINDASGSVATLQALINNARSANPNAILIIHLLSGATYWVNNTSGGLTLGSQECLLGSGATIQATNSAVTNSLVIINSGASNVSIAGGTYNANGADIYGIYAPSSSARINIDKVTVMNCGQDCIQLNGNGSGTFDNEITVTRCDLSGSPNHSGISIWNATQTTCVDNFCHSNSVGIWIGNGGYCNIANNICVSNVTGINCNSGNDNYVFNNTCNNNGTGVYAGGSGNMIVSDLFTSNSVAAINSSGSGNIFCDNLFANGNATNFLSNGSGDDVVAYEGSINASNENYFYPPLINNQHNTTIVNGKGRYDLYDSSAAPIDNVQTEYNAAVSANPGEVIVLHLNGNYTVGSNPLTLSSDTCILLGGTIQMSSSSASEAIYASGQSYISISGGTIDGGTTSSSGAGHGAIYFTGCSMFQIDGMTLQNFGTSGTRVGGSDVVRIDHGSTPRIFTRNTIINGSARGFWLATGGVRDVVSDNTVSGVQMDGVDCDESTYASLVKFNYLHNNSRYGVFLEQSASQNCVAGNICNYNSSYDIGCYNNSSSPRSATADNSVICNSLLGDNGLRNGSTGDGNSVTSSDNFFFDNTVMSANIQSQLFGANNYYSQNYMGNSSLSTSGTEVFFNSPDVSGNLYVQDGRSGLEAVVTNASLTQNAPVILGPTNSFGSDQWSFIPTDSGYYQIVNKNSTLDMNVAGASTSTGAPIIQWPFGSNQNDQWMPMSAGNGLYYLLNRHSGLTLDCPASAAGAQLDQQNYSGAANQQFMLLDTPPPVPVLTGTSLTWNSGGVPDGNWQNPANWGGESPQAGDLLGFGSGAQLLTTNNFSAGTAFGNLAFSASAPSFTLSGNGIVLTNATEDNNGNLSGGAITDASINNQTVSLPVTISTGNHAITTVVGAGQLNLSGAFTRNADALVQYTVSGGGINCSGSGLANNSSGIIGGWAVVGLGANVGDWAALSSGNVGAYSSYVNVSGGASMGLSSSGGNAASDVKINSQSGTASTLNSTTAGTYDISTLAWNIGNSNPGGDQTLNLSSGQILRLGANGGIMNVHAGSHTLNIGNNGGGSLTAGGAANTAGEISLYAVPFNNGNQRLQINAPINDNGSGKVSVNILGDVEFKQNGNFSGGLYVGQGRAQANTTGAFGTGPVYVFPGGEAFPWNSGNSGTFTNNFFLAGYGSPQDSMALRGQNGVTLSGAVTLMGTAVIAPAGSNPAFTLSGSVTGPGGMYLVGAFGDGSLHLGGSSQNTYAGDTTIDAVGIGNSGSHNVTVWINNSSHNNLMPSGPNAGNLILKGDAGTLAEFDLGGSTQTVNGLISSNTASETLVTSNPGGGMLNVGANNATSEFDGIIGFSGGNGTANLSLVKIGAGTLTLGGINNYTGSTTVSNGVLALTGAGSISNSATITVADGATLDVSGRPDQTLTLSSGQILQGGGTIDVNLTVGTGAKVMPGNSNVVDTLTVAGAAQLGGTSVIKLNATTGASDQINASSIIYGGTLTVTNISGTLAAGQSFQLFLGSYSGGFSSINLPPLAGGLLWGTNNLAINGTLQVVSATGFIPVFTSFSVAGTNLLFSGTNGVPGENYYLLVSTNLALPVTNWTIIATNTFDGSGNFNLTNPVNPAVPQNFYLLEHL